jgi:hypothetical protein
MDRLDAASEVHPLVEQWVRNAHDRAVKENSRYPGVESLDSHRELIISSWWGQENILKYIAKHGMNDGE